MGRNVLSNWAGLLVNSALTFFLTPMLIRELGDFQYGLWILLTSIVDYAGLLDLGIRTAMHRFVGRLKGQNDRTGLNEVLASSLAVGLTASTFVLIVTLLVMAAPGMVGISAANYALFRWPLIIISMNVMLALPSRVLGAYLCGLQRFDAYNAGAIVASMVRAVLIVTILRLKLGLAGVAAVTFATTMLSTFLYWLFIRYTDPAASLNLRLATWRRARELTSYGVFVSVNSLGDSMRFYSSSFVIGKLLDVAFITPFSVANRLMVYLRMAVFGFVGPLMPHMSELDGQGRRDDLKEVFFRGIRGATLLSTFFGALLILNGRSLLVLWLGARFGQSYGILVILTVGYCLMLAQYPANVVMCALARQRALAFWTVAEGAANLLLSIWLVQRYGLTGVAFGTVLPMLLVTVVIQPCYVLSLLKIPVWEYLRKSLLRPALVLGLFSLLTAVLGGSGHQPSVVRFLVSVAWQSALFGILAYGCGLVAAERRSLAARISAAWWALWTHVRLVFC